MQKYIIFGKLALPCEDEILNTSYINCLIHKHYFIDIYMFFCSNSYFD